MTLTTLQQTDLQFRISIARGHLRSNDVKEAARVFATCIIDYPEDLESYLVLGDLQLAAEDASLALSCYQAALMVFPDRVELQKRIQLTRAEYGQVATIAGDQFRKWLKSLASRENPISDESLAEASALLQEIISSQQPAELVAENLDRIETLLPAFLELNIRQAKAENRNDVQRGLEQIKQTLVSNQPDQPAFGNYGLPRQLSAQIPDRITILVSGEMQSASRVQMMLEIFKQLGADVILKSVDSPDDGSTPDLVIASNPHLDPWLLEQMARYTAGKIPMVLDLEMDFEKMPITHPDYMTKGLGLPVNARAYTAAMVLAGMITTPSKMFADQLNHAGHHAFCIPEGWSHNNPLWQKLSPKRPTIHIGWVGNTGCFDDIVEIRRILIRVIREFPNTQLIISEDAKAFQLFDSIPENRKLFLPEVAEEDYPYIYNQIDILAVPLRNIPFNHSLPDTPFIYAGIKQIPWVASKTASALEWNSGGLTASTLEEWHTNLRQLVMDAELREKLGKAGYRKSMGRETEQLIPYWRNVLQEVSQTPWAAASTRSKDKNFHQQEAE